MKNEPSFSFEKEVFALGYRRIVGVDEAGRGCLAGPVVAAAVILPFDHSMIGINDSKALTPQRREKLYQEIYSQAVAIGVGRVGPDVIDEINILQASILAMKKAISAIDPSPDFLLVDGNLKQLFGHLAQRSIVKGDKRSQSIAAASIIAKVFRDQIMREYHLHYSVYDFSEHKGYPTEKHLAALKTHGVTAIHRKTFRGVRELLPV